MGWLSAIWEIFKVVAPHAAPHVTQAMRDRRSREAAERKQREEAHAARNAEDIVEALVALEHRISAAEDRAAAADERTSGLQEKLAQVEAQAARNVATTRIWVVCLLAWNAVVTVVLLYLIFQRK